MKLYRYSEVSKRVEESEAILIDKPVGGPLASFTPYGPDVYQVAMHGTVEIALLRWLLLRWDYTLLGALDKRIKQEQKEVTKCLDNLVQLKVLRENMNSSLGVG
jgi:hypothetical protein